MSAKKTWLYASAFWSVGIYCVEHLSGRWRLLVDVENALIVWIHYRSATFLATNPSELSRPVLLLLKLNNMLSGYFDPVTIIMCNENKLNIWDDFTDALG